MVTEDEKQEIIDKAVEKAMILLPEVVGNLMAQHIALSKINTEFYSAYPEFADKKAIVASVLESIDGENPFIDYKSLLEKAVPLIRERIRIVKDIDVVTVSQNPNRDFKALDMPNHGEL